MIEISQLTKRYDSHIVLKDINLRFRAGLITGVAGPNACGKTTLIKCILGLSIPSRGVIRLNGMPTGANPSFRRLIGYMPQNPSFPENLSLQELIEMLEDLRGEKASQGPELISCFGLEPILKQPFGELSGGTKQKVAAVVAFLFDSPWAILDEPTAGLDPVSSVRFKDLLKKKAAQGRSILLVSHFMSEIEQLATDIVFMTEGEVKFSGTIEEIQRETRECDLERAVVRLFTRSGEESGGAA